MLLLRGHPHAGACLERGREQDSGSVLDAPSSLCFKYRPSPKLRLLLISRVIFLSSAAAREDHTRPKRAEHKIWGPQCFFQQTEPISDSFPHDHPLLKSSDTSLPWDTFCQFKCELPRVVCYTSLFDISLSLSLWLHFDTSFV